MPALQTKRLHFYEEKMTTQLSIPYPINSVNFTALCSKKPVHRYNKKTVPGVIKNDCISKQHKIRQSYIVVDPGARRHTPGQHQVQDM
ncbi:hypothetical protein T4A_13783 [Trichinella pseudospiralis]|uniref:Uncharacterized protein n=1 Tax=Trichinella pseudospiralis TaxID=6337 RepID=A0A0V1DP31_TRIPS|nr:hypothetical protein T4A_6311 [Trichinella pseudospiralis]KRY63311.1 hypothetical protein T4A_13783 [Trichinella pseudospiralis]